jgi:D-sedoheptulose 7-phosphate isomerase
MPTPEERVLHEAAASFQLITGLVCEVRVAKDTLLNALRSGNRVFLCGNGGSAADCQHLAAEFVGRFLLERTPLPAIALTVNTSVLTSIANDYSYATVFSRQVRGLGRAGDVLIGLSTSGNSENVVAAIEMARSLGMLTIALTGKSDSAMSRVSDQCVQVPSTHPPRIQEMHIAIGHAICELVEAEYAQGEALCNA